MWRATEQWVRLPALLAACLLTSGCPETAEDENRVAVRTSGYEGVELKLALPASLGLRETWAPAVNDWAAENAAVVDLVEVASAGDWEQWKAALSDPSATLALLPTVLLSELVGEENAAVIPAGLIDRGVIGWSAVPPTVRSTLGMLESDPAFVTATCPTPVLGIRSDLLQASDRAVPATWEEYDRLVLDLDHWAPQHVAVEPRTDQALPTLFLARALSGAKHPSQLSVELDVSSAEPAIDSSAYVRALEEMQALTPQLAENVREMTPTDCRMALEDGSAAIGIFWSEDSFEASNSVSASSEPQATSDIERGPLTFVPLPGQYEVFDRDGDAWTARPDEEMNRPALCGFAGLSAVVTRTDDAIAQEAAWDLWGLLHSYQTEGTIPPLPGALLETSAAPGIAKDPGLTAAEEQELRNAAISNLHNPLLVCELPMYGRSDLRAVLGVAITTALDEERDAELALEEASRQWTESIEALGRTKVLNSYRRRLGLFPLPD